ncbi:MAG: hypothetical protein JXR25_16530 [Pontiellaceae bacterium]|nr:hypothetical protein [Pontiellaceae bacterium]MBN2786428.1 hypothetical protein [Pontiellaceae bacterium]
MQWKNRLGILVLAAWCGTVVPQRAAASGCSVDPAVPASGHKVTVIYNPAGGPLADAGTVYAHRSYNYWSGSIDDPAMTASNGLWVLTYLVPQRVNTLDFVFHDGSGTWDNNSNSDWHFSVPLPDIADPPALPANASRAHVMMQGFYWDCPGGWYSTMASRAKRLRYMQGGYGIDRIWFPPPQKSSSWTSMGYDPYDYFDVGQYYQNGKASTRFGTQGALKNATAAFRDKGIRTLVDVVLNHRAGGAAEANPVAGTTTWTDYSAVASGMAAWDYSQFHPSTEEAYDEGAFDGFNDVCHVSGYSAGSAYYDLIAWGNWLADTNNAGFDGGWRFDYPKGINPSFIADFRKETGDAFGILEYWDGNISLIEDYAKYSGDTSAFDFPAFYTMIDVFNDGGHIGRLIDSTRVYAAKNPDRAVTFVANHDTDKDVDVVDIADKMLAYAYILTYQGYPCIFWKDYYNYGLASLGGQAGNGIDPLVWVRGALGGGDPDIQLLKVDDSDLLVYGTLNGSVDAPGYIVAINTHASSAQSVSVTTANTFLRGKTLQCHAWYSYADGQNVQPASVSCSAGGVVTVAAPARGYAVYSVETDLPDPWAVADVGTGGLEGSAIVIGDRFTLVGTGANADAGSEGLTFVYQSIDGDAGIEANILDLDDTDASAGAGVMFRPDTTTNSASAAVWVTPGNGVVFQWRSEDDSAVESVSAAGVTAPCRVRLIRSSDRFSGYYSQDGSTWIQLGAGTVVSMSSDALVGMAVASGTDDTLNLASFAEVSLNHAPVMSAVSNQVLIAGNTLALTNRVSDADNPAQELSYMIVSIPSGAVFEESTGIFSWRPAMADAPSSSLVVWTVADNGIPPLSASTSFAVEVIAPAAPTLSSVSITNGVLGFQIDGDSGPDYSVLHTTNLTSETWTPLFSTNSPSLPFYWSAPTSGVQREFFKIELGP